MDGQMGFCPNWYMLIKAARYLRVSPWDLYSRSVVWQDWAFKAMAAEAHSQKIHAERKSKKPINKLSLR